MSHHEIPPFLQSVIDQTNAQWRDELAIGCKVLLDHAAEVHDGEVTPCGQAMVAIHYLNQKYSRHNLAALLGYAVRQIVQLREQLDDATQPADDTATEQAEVDAFAALFGPLLGMCAQCGVRVFTEDIHTGTLDGSRVWCSKCSGLSS